MACAEASSMLFQAFSSALVSPGVTMFPCLSAQYGTVMLIKASASCSTILATARPGLGAQVVPQPPGRLGGLRAPVRRLPGLRRSLSPAVAAVVGWRVDDMREGHAANGQFGAVQRLGAG